MDSALQVIPLLHLILLTLVALSVLHNLFLLIILFTFGGQDSVSFNLDMTSNNPTRFKYSEERILKELTDYISATYNQHYSAGDDKVQTLDLIEACGDGESFCRSNILKYASRYDKKGTARRDIMKILHYAVLLMHFNDKNAQRETYPQ